MQKRGRPPHRDILTPREWEVLALLREGLTNERIAQRLNISLDGAKYHVSEILGKLGVSSREEAAAWTPGERPWWARLVSLPLLAKGASAAVVVSVAGGVGVLTWGVMNTNQGAVPAPTTTPVITRTEDVVRPATPPAAKLSSDEAIAAAFEVVEDTLAGDDLQDASALFTTFADAAGRGGGPFTGPDSPSLPADNTPVWLVTMKGVFFDPFRGLTPGPGNPTCSEITIIIVDATGDSTGDISASDAEGCE